MNDHLKTLQTKVDEADEIRLAEIRADALSETNEGQLDLGHVSLPDVLDWIRIMSPVYAARVGWSSLMDFDVNSILRCFEEWTQGKHDAELDRTAPAPTPGERNFGSDIGG